MCSISTRALSVLPRESQTDHHHTKLTEFANQIVSKFTRKDVHRKKSVTTSEQVWSAGSNTGWQQPALAAPEAKEGGQTAVMRARARAG